MRFPLLWLFRSVLLLWPALVVADEAPLVTVLAWKGDKLVVLERETDADDDAAGSGLAATVSIQLGKLAEGETALGLRPLFPEGTSLSKFELVGSAATVEVELPPNSWDDEVAGHQEISYLLGQWADDWLAVDEISLHLSESGGGGASWVIKGLVRPVASKPEPEVSKLNIQSSMKATSQMQAPVQGTAQPLGALSDASIFLSPGHGWNYVTALSRWGTQRGNLHQYIEDMGTGEAVLQYLHQYLWNAGARIYTTRERDMNRNMVIVQHGTAGYQQTGTWTAEAMAGAYEGSQRYASTVSGEASATARFTPNIPKAGNYAVYVWYRPSAAGTTAQDASITINHTGTSTRWIQNQNRDGRTWKYVGTYHFEEGSNPASGSVLINNLSSLTGQRVIAGAVRFGGGMGDVADEISGTTSGKPRWEESGRYNAGFMGKADWADSNTVSAMPRWAAWEHESWEDGKSVYVSWHTNAGGGTGTETFSHITPVAGSDQLRNRIHDQVIRDVRAAWNPTWADRGKKTANFGELNPTNNSKMPAALVEVGFHDHVNDTKHLLDPEFRRQMARAVYKGIVQYYANDVSGFTNSTYLPEPPQRLRVRSNSNGTVTLAWDTPLSSSGTTGIYGHAATGYRVYRSKNGRGFDHGVAVTGTTTTLGGFTPGEVVYFRVSANNAGGESFPTAVLAARPTSASSRILVVNGFDRNDRFMNTLEKDPHSTTPLQRGYVDRLNTFNYIIPHAKALQAYAKLVGFDSAEASAVESGAIALTSYDAVIWMAGLQAHVNDIGTRPTPAFTSTLRSRLDQYRAAGGQLFISGAEVAWDANREGQTPWLEANLKARLVARGAAANSAAGRSASIMSGWAGRFDDGGGDGYRVEFPDVIAPVTGAVSAMRYTGMMNQEVAGFESIAGWKQPSFSGQTNADPSSSFAIVASPVQVGFAAGRLSYVWGGGNFIRLYNETRPPMPADSNVSFWIHGDGSKHRVRLAVRDSDGEIFVGAYATVDFTGWREIQWADVRKTAQFWAVGGGDGKVTGPDVALDSIQISRTEGSPSSGMLHFDHVAASPIGVDGGTVETAAVQYDGAHRVVYLGFPFERITSEASRADLMARTLDFFGFSPTPFQKWQQLHFTSSELNDPAVSGDLADPSGDGIPNILKYAFNLNPRISSRSGLPEELIVDGKLTLKFNIAKAATDIVYQVEVSDDLVTWKSGDGETQTVSAIDGGDVWKITVRDLASTSGNAKRFIRVRVTR